MPLYHWQALTHAGEPRQGALAGESEVQVIELLRRQGLRVTRVQPEQAARELPRVRSHAPELRLLRELLALRGVGVGVPAALELLAATRADGELALVRRAVEAGQPLGEALARVPERFDALVCQVLAAGEARGDLDGALHQLVDHLERAGRPTALGGAVRRLVWTTSAAVLLAILALVLLIPAAAGLYLRLGVELPAASAALLDPCVVWQPQIRWLAGGVAALGLALAGALRTPRLRTTLDAWLLRVPGLGPALRLHGALRLTRLLALLASVELPLLTALELAAPRLGAPSLGLALLAARTQVAQGIDAGAALTDAGLLPPVALELLRGAERGERATALAALAQLHAAECDERARHMHRVARGMQAALALVVIAVLALVLAPLRP